MSKSVEPRIAEEPCLKCGEETAVGSYHFCDRHDVHLADGTRVYLCADCIKQIRAAGRPDESVTDPRMIEVMSMGVIMNWGGS
jgi:hypothetical protein